jgi:hypoxanthine phosphoribosyltransferase
MTGALTFAGNILPQLTMDLELSYIHATRYRNNIGQRQVEWIFQPEKEMIKDKVVLILDDILDQGITLKSIREKLLFLGAKKVFTAVLFDKWIKSEKSIEADFVGLNIPDKYVFGFGLDFDGIGRNMPHLYAYNKGE